MCAAECSFTSMKRIKTLLRITMKDERFHPWRFINTKMLMLITSSLNLCNKRGGASPCVCKHFSTSSNKNVIKDLLTSQSVVDKPVNCCSAPVYSEFAVKGFNGVRSIVTHSYVLHWMIWMCWCCKSLTNEICFSKSDEWSKKRALTVKMFVVAVVFSGILFIRLHDFSWVTLNK